MLSLQAKEPQAGENQRKEPTDRLAGGGVQTDDAQTVSVHTNSMQKECAQTDSMQEDDAKADSMQEDGAKANSTHDGTRATLRASDTASTDDAAAQAGPPTDSSDNIRVAIRFRPLPAGGGPAEAAWEVKENSVVALLAEGAHRSPAPQVYSFDKVYPPSCATTRTIYASFVADLTKRALAGINATIFAYGQTSAGKTYTMCGDEGSNPGIIQCAIEDLFALSSADNAREYAIRVSYLEIYNEAITDLLARPDCQRPTLKIHESLSRGIFVGNLSEEPVASPRDAMTLLRRGQIVRHTGETVMNERSSRSHALFKLSIESRVAAREQAPSSSRESTSGPVRLATLTFVDLAGSERARLTGAEGMRLKEGGLINKSLLALTTVISKLSEGSDRMHIPFRDSKLTRILTSSLGGNALTAIICAASLAPEYAEETASTLKFATRAKKIRTRVRVNEIISDRSLIIALRDQVEALQAQIDAHRQEATSERPIGKRLRAEEDGYPAAAALLPIDGMAFQAVANNVFYLTKDLVTVREHLALLKASIGVGRESVHFAIRALVSRIRLKGRATTETTRYVLAALFGTISSLRDGARACTASQEASSCKTDPPPDIVESPPSGATEAPLQGLAPLAAKRSSLPLKEDGRGLSPGRTGSCGCVSILEELGMLKEVASDTQARLEDGLRAAQAAVEARDRARLRITALEADLAGCQEENAMLLAKIRTAQLEGAATAERLSARAAEGEARAEQAGRLHQEARDLAINAQGRLREAAGQFAAMAQAVTAAKAAAGALGKEWRAQQLLLSAAAEKEDALQRHILHLTTTNEGLTASLAAAQETIRAMEDSATACRSITGTLQGALAAAQEDAAMFKARTSEYEHTVEMQKASIEEGAEALERCKLSLHVATTTVGGLEERIEEQQAEIFALTAARIASSGAPPPAAAKRAAADEGVLLRIELEKLRESSARERRLLQLKISDLEEQVELLTQPPQ